MDEQKVRSLKTITEHLTFERGQVQGSLKREHAAVRDVSPCSEYTRYTMEGTLKDPFSDLAVLLDIPALGTLFMNGPFIEPRWSQALGYGLAIIEEDTRVHLYRSGKFVVRRARDKEHVEACYRRICDMVRPAIVLSGTGLLFYEAVALSRHFIDAGFEEEILTVLKWPEVGLKAQKDLELFIDGPEGTRERLRELVLNSIRSLLSGGTDSKGTDQPILERARGEVISSMGSSMKELKGNGPLMSSTASIHLSALRSLEMIKVGQFSMGADPDLHRSLLDLVDSAGAGQGSRIVDIHRHFGSHPIGDAAGGLMAAFALVP